MDEKVLQERLIEVGVPGHIVEGLAAYVVHGRPTGSFLMAVLENKFIRACMYADDVNRRALWEIAIAIYNEVPASCHGSPEKVEAWMAHEGMRGIKISWWLEIEKKYLADLDAGEKNVGAR